MIVTLLKALPSSAPLALISPPHFFLPQLFQQFWRSCPPQQNSTESPSQSSFFQLLRSRVTRLDFRIDSSAKDAGFSFPLSQDFFLHFPLNYTPKISSTLFPQIDGPPPHPDPPWPQIFFSPFPRTDCVCFFESPAPTRFSDSFPFTNSAVFYGARFSSK